MKNYRIGKVVKCLVTGIESYGIFVNIDEHYNGLIHISEVTFNYVRNLNDYAKVGDVIFAEIIDIDENEFKIKLSIKNIDYKQTGILKKILESGRGFKPLEDMLPKWTFEKLQEISKKEL